jgi:hypothetical protein
MTVTSDEWRVARERNGQEENGKNQTRQILCRFLCTLLLAIIGFLSAAMGQTGTATLSGIVTDEGGGVVPNCEIQLQSVARGNKITVKTNNDGIYVFSGVQPGSYNLTIRRGGFKQVDFLNLLLNTQDHVQQNFRLQVGSVSESVTVNANAEHLATDNPAVGVLVNRDFVENTPLNGRSFQDLIALAPGAVSSASGDGYYSVNGQREDANYFTVDGVAANVNPEPGGIPGPGFAGAVPSQTILGTTQSLASVDALQEFKIQTSGYSAEYGRQPGGQIELTTRSGTDRFHGSLFDYFRNEALDANCWLCNNQVPKTPRPPERQNDFGGTLGGPVALPQLGKGGNATFFFVSFEGLRLQTPAISEINVPTPALRLFAAPGLQPFLDAIPLPNRSDNTDSCLSPLGSAFTTIACTAPFFSAYSSPSSLDALRLRFDKQFGEKIQLFGSYARTPSSKSARQSGSALVNDTLNSDTLTIGSTWKMSATFVNELRFNYSQSSGTQNILPIAVGGAVPFARDLLAPTAFAPPDAAVVAEISFQIPGSNQFTPPNYTESRYEQHQYNILDAVSWLKRSHGIKMGMDYRRLAPVFNGAQYFRFPSVISLDGLQQGFADVDSVGAGHVAHPTFTNFSLYAQDQWRVGPNLSLSYGIRWEYNPAIGAADGIYPVAVTSSDPLTLNIAPSRTSVYATRYNNFAPRFGFAYTATSSKNYSVAIRGSFGIFYDTGQALGAVAYDNYPFFAFNSLANTPFPTPQAVLTPPPLNVPLTPPYGYLGGAVDPKLRLPYTEQWNLSVDQVIASHNTLTISYVGNAGRKILLNEGVYTNPNFPNGLGFTYNGSSSIYEGLQIQDQGYLWRGAQIVSSYTFAHARDNASFDLGTTAPAWGNSVNDVRHLLNTAVNYEIPHRDDKNALAVLMNDVALNARFFAQTGYPIDVLQGFYVLPDGQFAAIRPDLNNGVPIYLNDAPASIGGWGLNRAAFQPVPVDPNTGFPLRTGNLGRNSIRGPGFWSLNASAQKTFRIHDQLGLMFRVDAFNLLNHPNASGHVDNCVCDTTFGQQGGLPQTIGVANSLYATGSPRSLQLMLKFQF